MKKADDRDGSGRGPLIFENRMSDRSDVGLGPRLLAIETAIRALIEQASSNDPTLRDRIKEAADAYLATIPRLSELEREFIERARACIASIVRPSTA